jgi:hypothetical protein
MITLSPERQHLAQVIDRVAQAEAELARLAEAREKIGRPQIDAITEAEAALAEAHAREPQRLVDDALGRASDKQPSVAEAEEKRAEVKAEMERRRGAQALLDGEQERLESRLRFAVTDRGEAIAAVVRAEALASLFAAFDEALDRVADLRSIFASLGPAMTQRDLDHAAVVVGHTGSGRGVAQWRVALKTLESDPTAPLPDAKFGDDPPSAATAKAA